MKIKSLFNLFRAPDIEAENRAILEEFCETLAIIRKKQMMKAIDELNQAKGFDATTLKVKAIVMLQERGSITNRELVGITNGQTWLTSRLRRDGFIKPFINDTWETSTSGKRYKRYYWTGKTINGSK